GGTYGGNPIACAAALATIATMRELDLPARARHIEQIVTGRLRALAAEIPAIGDVRGRGAMLAMEFVVPGTTEPDAALTRAVAAGALEQGVILLTCGTDGNVVRLLPPLVIGDELLTDALDVLDDVVRAAARNRAERTR
ncbi:aminotransferase class III-fold pyridoxal phosphate-dependent enzyme, partial [Nocardia elegans]